MKHAAIDLGTNTALLLILDERMDDVLDISTIVRLGEGLAATGRIGEAAVKRAVGTLRRYVTICREHGAAIACSYGTAALREAANRSDVVERIEGETGLVMKVLSEYEEAYYAYLSVRPDVPEEVDSFAVVDIGGGSTEVIPGTIGAFGPYRSLPLGIVKLAEGHIRHDPPLQAELDAVAGEVREKISASGVGPAAHMIAIGGTMTTLAAISMGLRQFDRRRIEGFRFSRGEIDQWVLRLAAMKRQERESLPGMEPGREGLLLPGVILMREIMACLEVPAVAVSTKGGRYGLLYEMANRAAV